MTFERVLLVGVLCYVGIFFLLSRLFPRTDVSTFSTADCPHAKREEYEPTWSVGDESDYRSRCVRCGEVLRRAPNA